MNAKKASEKIKNAVSPAAGKIKNTIKPVAEKVKTKAAPAAGKVKEKFNAIKYKVHYSAPRFWKKIKKVAVKGGETLTYTGLLLYYVMADSSVPKRDKAKIIGALGYLILPLDFIPDFIPFIGYSDDLSALVWALRSVWKNLTPQVHARAGAKLREWFPSVSVDGLDSRLLRLMNSQAAGNSPVMADIPVDFTSTDAASADGETVAAESAAEAAAVEEALALEDEIENSVDFPVQDGEIENSAIFSEPDMENSADFPESEELADEEKHIRKLTKEELAALIDEKLRAMGIDPAAPKQ